MAIEITIRGTPPAEQMYQGDSVMLKLPEELDRKLNLARRSLAIFSIPNHMRRKLWNEVAELACDCEDNTTFQEACNVLSLLPETNR